MRTDSRVAIRQLSPSVVNKIAAGEVIERPASVVKELVENAIDADATRIDVTVEQGGCELIRVVDDGCGIAAEELPLAVASHATSKIADADDLFRVGSLGFRGEALASIAEVSQCLIRSRPHEEQAGAELSVVGGELGEVAPCSSAPGTTIEVHRLFFNTPVRRKYLRTPQTEIGHATEAFTRLALAHPHLAFALRTGKRTVHELPATDDWVERIAHFFGEELADGLIEVESDDGEVRLSGYVADPSQSRSHSRMQYVFLNGRYIRDRALQHALGEAYRGLLMTGRYPICFLQLDMPPDLVDVNVHPTKLEVRFQDSGRHYSQLLGMLRTRFLTADLTARGRAPNTASPGTADAERAEAARRELVDWAKGQLGQSGSPSEPSKDENPTYPAAKLPELPPPTAPLQLNSIPSASELSSLPDATDLSKLAESAARKGVGMQIHNRYLVTESDEGIVVIDQHALHERVLYEQLRGKVSEGGVEMQRLLVPEAVDLAPEEAAVITEHADLLAQLGMTVEPFGGSTVLVSAYPAMLANFNPVEVIREMAGQLVAGKQPNRRDLLDELLNMIACKAAIKAGDQLSGEEIDALIAQRHLARDAHHCPHGRPTALVFTREELDRQFKRT